MVEFWKPHLASSGPAERYKRRLSALSGLRLRLVNNSVHVDLCVDNLS